MKRIIIVLALLSLILVSAFSEKVKVGKKQIVVSSVQTIAIKKIEIDMDYFAYEGWRYSSRSDDYRMLTLVYALTNTGDTPFTDINAHHIGKLAVLCVDMNGFLSVVKSKESFGQRKELKPKSTEENATAFMYQKDSTPIALISENDNLILKQESDKDYGRYVTYLERHESLRALIGKIKVIQYSEIRSILDEHGILLEDRDDDGLPLIYHAVRKGNLEALQGLVDDGADTNSRYSVSGIFYESPLYTAVMANDGSAAEILIKGGADVGFAQLPGMGLGELAIIRNSYAVVPVLQRSGIDFKQLMMKSKDGSIISALEYAKSMNFVEMADFLSGLE